MSKHHHRKPGPQSGAHLGFSASECLEMAEGISSTVGTQLTIGAEIMGVEYEDFIERLALESAATSHIAS